MAISNNSTGLRPGVCTSTTRPTAPYEGQMIYETDTDLTYVWGGSAWQQVSGGTAVGNSGLVYVGSVTAGSAVSTLTLNSVFSATYNAYRIVVSGGTASNATVSCTTQLIDSGGTPVTTGYYEVFLYSTYSSSGASTANSSNISSFLRGVNSIGAGYSMTGVFDLINPFTAEPTHYYNSVSPIGGNAGLSMGYQSSASSYTGLKLTATAGTMTNTVLTVYGYRK